MTFTRTGKIARLPLAVRDQLNHRLHEGERQQLLVDWLNALPAVQAVLAAEFAGAPVTEQNLSNWKLGGFADWLRHQESREALHRLLEGADGLKADQGDSPLADRLAPLVALALGTRLQQAAAAAPDDSSSLAPLLDLARALTRQRRCDHAEARLNHQREQWAAEDAQALEQRRLAAEKLRLEKEALAQSADRRARREADFFRQHGHMPFAPPPPLGPSPAPELLKLIATLPPAPATMRPAAPSSIPPEMLHLLASMGSDPAASLAGLPTTAQSSPPACSPPPPASSSASRLPGAPSSSSLPPASWDDSAPPPRPPVPLSIQPNPGESNRIQPKINSPAILPFPLAC